MGGYYGVVGAGGGEKEGCEGWVGVEVACCECPGGVRVGG